MTVLYLLDTNVISETLKPSPNKDVLSKLKRNQLSLAVPSPVWHELLFGCYRLPVSNKRRAIEEYLHQVVAATMPIYPYDEHSAAWHAAERARLGACGLTPPFVDGQIASIAKVNDLTLVTFNVSDYKHFPGVKVEDWR